MKDKVRFRPLRVSDFYEIELQPRHRHWEPVFHANPLILHQLCENPFCFTMEVDGKPIAAAGVTHKDELWAFLRADMRRHMLRFSRYGCAMIGMYGRPVYADIDRTNPGAVRWALLMGFRKVKIATEGTMDRYARTV